MYVHIVIYVQSSDYGVSDPRMCITPDPIPNDLIDCNVTCSHIVGDPKTARMMADPSFLGGVTVRLFLSQ